MFPKLPDSALSHMAIRAERISSRDGRGPHVQRAFAERRTEPRRSPRGALRRTTMMRSLRAIYDQETPLPFLVPEPFLYMLRGIPKNNQGVGTVLSVCCAWRL